MTTFALLDLAEQHLWSLQARSFSRIARTALTVTACAVAVDRSLKPGTPDPQNRLRSVGSWLNPVPFIIRPAFRSFEAGACKNDGMEHEQVSSRHEVAANTD